MEAVWIFTRMIGRGGRGVGGVGGVGVGVGALGVGGVGCVGGGGGIPPHVFRAHHLLRRSDVTMIVKMR